MFTGIVQGMATVSAIEDKPTMRHLTITLPEGTQHNIELGASIANNGCCLTVVANDQREVRFDLMQETLDKTNLSDVMVGDKINIERAARFGDEIGGHAVSGHISTQAQVREVKEGDNQKQIWFTVPKQWMKYILTKGFVAVDGCSLTVGEVDETGFCVYLIPETLSRTCFGTRSVGDTVNIEVDPQTQAVVDTVERVLKQKTL